MSPATGGWCVGTVTGIGLAIMINWAWADFRPPPPIPAADICKREPRDCTEKWWRESGGGVGYERICRSWGKNGDNNARTHVAR